MPVRQPRYTVQEAGRRGAEIYERDLRARLEPAHNGEIVAIDLDSGEWELGIDQDSASAELEVRRPDAQIIVMRVGTRYMTKFGAGRSGRVV